MGGRRLSNEPPDALISDANVLIDFAEVDPEILRLMATTLWQLHVSMDVLREVRALSAQKARSLGLIICEPTIDEIKEASAPGGGLSGPDRLCLAMAKGRGWACLTNDQRLRGECKSSGVQVLWGLEALVLLHKAEVLTKTHAVKTAEAIRKANPRHITEEILRRFCEQLSS